MKPEDIRHLLGGYASGTLSEAEQKLLFDAALEDQVLFDAMAEEQALKDLLDDPESRGYLQAVLDEQPPAHPSLHATALPAPAPAPAPMQSSAPASIARQIAPPPPPGKRPSMLWGLLAAAALATVSVVGILKMNEKPAPTEVAGNAPAPQPTLAPPGSKPKEAIVEPARKSAVPREATTAPKPPSEPAAKKKRDTEQRKQEPEAANKAAVAIGPAPVVAPAPPPPPIKEIAPAAPQQPPPAPPVAQDQVQVGAQRAETATVPAPGARQMFQAAEQARLATEPATSARAKETSVQAKHKDSSPAKAIGGALAATRPATAQAAFAMRYKITRNNVPVAPGATFKIGEELVITIEKNSGGTATIDKLAGGATIAIPLAIQSNTVAQSVPVTVTGPMEIALILNRTPPAPARRRLVPSPSASQKSEVADGMVYVAEPSNAAGEPLVIRIPIRIE